MQCIIELCVSVEHTQQSHKQQCHQQSLLLCRRSSHAEMPIIRLSGRDAGAYVVPSNGTDPDACGTGIGRSLKDQDPQKCFSSKMLATRLEEMPAFHCLSRKPTFARNLFPSFGLLVNHPFLAIQCLSGKSGGLWLLPQQ